MKPLLWMRLIRDHVPKANRTGRTTARYAVLWALALRMDMAGRGFASQRQLGGDVDADERTVRRHLKWARDTGYLDQLRRGHRVSPNTVIASEYQLTEPASQPDNQPDEDVDDGLDVFAEDWEPGWLMFDGTQPDMGVPLGTSQADTGVRLEDGEPPTQPDRTSNPTGQKSVPNRTPMSAPEVLYKSSSSLAKPNRASGRVNGDPVRALVHTDDDEIYRKASKRCLAEPDFGLGAQGMARNELGEAASIREVVIRAAQILEGAPS